MKDPGIGVSVYGKGCRISDNSRACGLVQWLVPQVEMTPERVIAVPSDSVSVTFQAFSDIEVWISSLCHSTAKTRNPVDESSQSLVVVVAVELELEVDVVVVVVVVAAAAVVAQEVGAAAGVVAVVSSRSCVLVILFGCMYPFRNGNSAVTRSR